ncbi:MAG: hypothetical protein HYX26_03355 [Acidobacteriales bacterium]|nr:hypothetical protein [Terriglobales bacterium]
MTGIWTRNIAPLLALGLLVGCGMQVKSEKDGEKGEKVAISTPLGELKANTSEVNPEDTGLTVYPGSRLKPKTDKNEGRANINLNTPWFGLKVVAISYETDAAPDKVWEYYKAEMNKKYGRTLECRPGSPDLKIEKRNKDELVCFDENNKKGHNRDVFISADNMELKSGSKERQRIVSVKPTSKGTEFALVYVVTRGEKNTM